MEISPKLDCFLIDGLNTYLIDYLDLKSIINLTNTCKKYNKIYKPIKIIKILYIEYNLHIKILNLIKHDNKFFELETICNKNPRSLYKKDKNKCEIEFIIFKILLDKIIKKNQYQVIYTSAFLDIIFLYHQKYNYIKWKSYLISYINDNITLIKKSNRIVFWNELLKMRNHYNSSPKIEYDELNDKYIDLTIQ